MWVKEQEDDEGGIDRTVIHEYYSKDVSSKAVIHSQSAMPNSTKRTILTQEVLLIMLRSGLAKVPVYPSMTGRNRS